MHCVAFFLPLFVLRRHSYGVAELATGKHSKEERRPLSAAVCEDQMHVKRKEAAEGFGVSSAAPLISLKAFIVSSGRAADEELHRRREESERKWKLVRGRC